MKINSDRSSQKPIKGRPDYYKTPTHDFTEYTKDCEEKYWTKETAFDWQQDVGKNLKENLENLDLEKHQKIISMVLPMVSKTARQKRIQIIEMKLPLNEDALRDIGECISSERWTIHQALSFLTPLKEHRLAVSKLEDQLEILNSDLVDVREQVKLGLIKVDGKAKQIETESESQRQADELFRLTSQIKVIQTGLNLLLSKSKTELKALKTKIRENLNLIEDQIIIDLEETEKLIERALQHEIIAMGSRDSTRLNDLVFKRQFRALRDIANHALVVEQSAIAPLTMGVIHYKRYREIQEAMTTFINDEAKHSATFRRFLVEKLEAKEFISAQLISGAEGYMWLARFNSGLGMFLAVIIEAIGAAYLEFFSKEEVMPDKLFRSICHVISVQDEVRHMDLCVGIYNELFRKGTKWERKRNHFALKKIMKSVYGDKNDDHHLIQAFVAFGVESDVLYNHIVNLLSQQLSRISVYVEPEKILGYIDRKK
tara:strand:+ start:2021 stop:3475 length:1455 start_codon:yes stop_codon:yes gene_type:complete